MTHNIKQTRKAMTAIAAVLAFSSTPLLAQEATPPDPAADAMSQPTTDPLAPESSTTETATPPAPKPKVETTTTTTRTERATRTASRASARPAIRRAATPTPAATAPAAAEPIAPVPPSVEPQPPVAATPVAPPVTEPAPTGTETASADLTSEEMLPIAGAGALGLLALGGAGLVAMRRKRRREDAEYEARQQALAMIEDKPTPEPRLAENTRPAPLHDPVPARPRIGAGLAPADSPARISLGTRADADLMFRRADKDAKAPVDQH